MAYSTPSTRAAGFKVKTTHWNELVNDIRHIHGDDGTIAFIESASFTKSLDGGHTLDVQNSDTGTGALAVVRVQNDTGSTDALRLFCYGKSWTTSGMQVQDGANVEAGSNLSGGLSIGAAHASGVVRFFTAGTGTANERMRIGSAGAVYINDTSNAQQVIGLTINTGPTSSVNYEALSFKSSADVAHGMTSQTETDTYGFIAKYHTDNGGVSIGGFSEATGGLGLVGAHTTDDTTKSTAALAAIDLQCGLKSGTTVTSMGANANLVVIRDLTSARFIFDKEGDSHEDGTGWTAYDDHDDLALLNALDHSLDHKLRAEVGEWLNENKRALEAARIVTFNDDTDGRPFVNRSRLQMLLVGAVRQLGRELERHRSSLQSVRLLPEGGLA